MIADRIENLKYYPGFLPYAEKITAFIERVKTEELADGRYELMGDEMFALVQSYVTRPREEGRIEGHKIYSDLQYIIEGKEYIGWAPVAGLAVEEDHRPAGDILFYDSGKTYGGTLLEAGMFGFYLPTDGHMPCGAVGECAAARKIVFKIKAAE